MDYKEELASLRAKIDEIDKEILPLFEKRMQIADLVGDVKIKANMSVTDERRERQVIENVMNSVSAENKAEAISFMRNLMALSKIKQQKKTSTGNISLPPSAESKTGEVSVAYQGIQGAWGEQGAAMLFPQGKLQNFEYFEDVFEAVKNKQVDFGILPIENSHTGAIGETYDLLKRYGCYITGQIWVPITQCLLVKEGTSLKDIREVFSHSQGFNQCNKFLKNKSWDLTACRNTAVAAQMVAEKNDNRSAAIGSPRAAELYGLSVIAPSISDNANNQTRFIAISDAPIYDENSDTISITFSTLHRSGALCAVLQSFMVSGMNLTRIESRPVSVDKYRFFVDLQANILNETVADILREAAAQCEYFEILGCYKTK